MGCDLCGKQGSTRKTRIEGIVYDACSDCAKLGTDATPAQPATTTRSSKRRSRSPRAPVDENLFVRSDAGQVLRKKREQAGKTHAQFAQQLNVKESLLHAWETGSRTPTVDMAKSLEKQLSVSLLESGGLGADTNEYRSKPSGGGGGLTIADMLKNKDK